MTTPNEWESLLERSGFQRHMKILVLGDGNMSFSVSLAHMLGRMVHPGLLFVTTFDAEEVLRRKYEDIENNLLYLRRHNWVHVVPGVDARDITPNTFGHLFDRVIFNFPYTGSEDETSNGDLLRKLFRNLRPILRFDAEVHLRLCNRQDETWNVIPLITSCGFRVVARLPFAMHEFPGYQRRKLESDVEWPMSHPITLISMLDERVDPRPEWFSEYRSPRHSVPPGPERDFVRSSGHYPQFIHNIPRELARSSQRYEPQVVEFVDGREYRSPRHYEPSPDGVPREYRSPHHYEPSADGVPREYRSPWDYEHSVDREYRSPRHYEPSANSVPREYESPRHYEPSVDGVPREYERDSVRGPRHYGSPAIDDIPRDADYWGSSSHYVKVENGGYDPPFPGWATHRSEKRPRDPSWDSETRVPAVRRPIVVKKLSHSIPNKKQKVVTKNKNQGK